MKKLLLGMAFAALATGAQAQTMTPMQNDTGLIQAINEMAYVYGSICQSGDPSGCQGYEHVMTNANLMFQANNACMQGNNQGCQYYGAYYQHMEQDYSTLQQQMAMSGGAGYGGGYGGGYDGGGGYSGGVNPLGDTHQERMATIQDFGAQNTLNWQAQGAASDANHDAFIAGIRGD